MAIIRLGARKSMPKHLENRYTEEEFQALPKHKRADLRRPNYKRNNWPNHINRTYGLSREEYWKLYKIQNGLCAICRKPEISRKLPIIKGETRRLCIDHDHKTKRVRGLLCNHCNSMLGNALDDIEILKEAIKYLGGD